MNEQRKVPFPRWLILLCLTLMVFAAVPALTGAQSRGIKVTDSGHSFITVAWRAVAGTSEYQVFYIPEGTVNEILAGQTNGRSLKIIGLQRNTRYRINVYHAQGAWSITGLTVPFKPKATPKPTATTGPAPVTCSYLWPDASVTGAVPGTQCRMVGQAGVGRPDILARGVINAVDVWSRIPDPMEVCLRGHGWLLFLDADYAPRMEMELQHYHRAGMTCGFIDRAGTVVQLETPPRDGSAMPHAAPGTPAEPEAEATPAAPALPVFEAIPLIDCQIKLVETLFLRETPGGSIIDIVWLNSEVPAFEIKGYWYKVEFEGTVGYISRYHRKVLHGGCG